MDQGQDWRGWLEENGVPIDIQDIKDVAVIPNRIAEILMEKNIYPVLDEETLELINVESEEHWFKILSNQDQPKVFGEEGNLYEIAEWLDVELCDIYGFCHNKPEPCKGCRGEARWRSQQTPIEKN